MSDRQVDGIAFESGDVEDFSDSCCAIEPNSAETIPLPKRPPPLLQQLTQPTPADDAPSGFFASELIAQLFNRMVRERYGIHAPDHDFSQAWDLVRIVEIALNRAQLNTGDDAIERDRTAIRDAIASVQNYQGLLFLRLLKRQVEITGHECF